MHQIQISFLTAVTLAGFADSVGHIMINRVGFAKRHYLPAPLLGGLTFAILIAMLRPLGVIVHLPVSGPSVDFLIGLLTTNMGLHVTPKLLRQSWRPLLLFVGLGVLMYCVHLLALLPLNWLRGTPLCAAMVNGPLSFTGAPFNLNPPSQFFTLQNMCPAVFKDPRAVARGIMMIGVLSTPIVVGLISSRLHNRAGTAPKEPTPRTQRNDLSLFDLARRLTGLLVLILAILSSAFLLQAWLLHQFPALRQDHIPVILLTYLMAILSRAVFELSVGSERFPLQELNVLLLGPSTSLALAYAVMSIPLEQLSLVTPSLFLGALLAIAASVLTAWLAFPLFARVATPYQAAVISTAFLAVTTGWGPVGMGFLRRYIDDEGPVDPIAVILPMNAFYLFPWISILMTHLLLGWFG